MVVFVSWVGCDPATGGEWRPEWVALRGLTKALKEAEAAEDPGTEGEP